MNKKVLIAILCLFLVIVACESKTTSKRASIPERNTDVPAPTSSEKTQQPSGETDHLSSSTPSGPQPTAAETLKELQKNPLPISGPKTGNFYPQIQTTATGKEALAEKTRALFQQPVYSPKVNATGEFGAKYH